LVNVVFGEEFVEQFLKVNDRKARSDHEFKTTAKVFYIKANLAHTTTLASTIDKSGKGDQLNHDDDGLSLSTIDDNSDDKANDCYCDLVIPSGNHYLRDLTTNLHINLRNVDVFSTEGFCKKVLDLFAVRGVMRTNMHASGTHNSDPWNFVQQALATVKPSGLTHVLVYYFYLQCETTPGIDNSFQPFLDPELMGSTETMAEIADGHSPSVAKTGKRKVGTILEDVSDQLRQLIATTKEHAISQAVQQTLENNRAKDAAINWAAQQKLENERTQEAVKNQAKVLKWESRLKIAIALGDKVALKELEEEAKAFN
jgi:hypothetical protein